MSSPNDPGVSAERTALRVANKAVNRIGVLHPISGSQNFGRHRASQVDVTPSSARRDSKTGLMTWS
jgi:hypothetical protein